MQRTHPLWEKSRLTFAESAFAVAIRRSLDLAGVAQVERLHIYAGRRGHSMDYRKLANAGGYAGSRFWGQSGPGDCTSQCLL